MSTPAVSPQQKLAEVTRQRDEVAAANATILEFCTAEMSWEYFREEYFSDSISAKNARQLHAFLKDKPDGKAILAKAVAAATARGLLEALDIYDGTPDWPAAVRAKAAEYCPVEGAA